MEIVPATVVGAEVGELYMSLAKPLERIVRLDVHAPDLVIEEACQFAWARLVHHRSRVRRDAAQAWLVKTAVHEALKLVSRCRRELSLDAALESGGGLDASRRGGSGLAASHRASRGWDASGCAPGGLDASDRRPGPADVCEQRERLSRLSSLSRRQQRLLWLYGLGLTYEEIAAQAGCTRRTVERQIQRARATLRAAEGG